MEQTRDSNVRTVDNIGTSSQPAVNIKLTLADVVFLLHALCIFIAIVGTLLIWFQANLLNSTIGWSYSANFFTLAVAVILFALVRVPNNVVPPTHRDFLKHFGLLLFLTHIDLLVCATDWFVNYGFTQDVEGNTARAGGALVLIAMCGSFVLTFCLPGERPISETAKSALTIKGFVAVVTAVFMFVGQALTWGLKHNCTWFAGSGFYLRNVTPLVLGLLLIATVFLDDKSTHDVVWFLVLRYIFSVVPMFPGGPPGGAQSNFMAIYKAEICILFIGAVGFLVGVTVDRTVAFFGQSHSTEGTLVQKLTSRRMVLQYLLLALAIPGAIMVWTWSTHWVPINQSSRTTCYFAAIALVIPVLNILALITDFEYLTVATQVFAFHMGPMLAFLLLPPATVGFQVDSYYRAGVMLQLVVTTASPTLAFLTNRKTPVEDFGGGRDQNGGAVHLNFVFVAWCLAGAYSWYESLITGGDGLFPDTVYPSIGMIALLFRFGVRNRDAQRMVYLALLVIVSNSQVWPFTSAPIFSRVFITITGMLTLHFYSTEQKSGALEVLHGAQQSAGESSPHARRQSRAKDPVP